MFHYRVTAPDCLQAKVQLPASKSISNRALVISALAGGDRLPENISDCDDTRVMLRALAERPEVVDIMAAGTAMRFLTAYLSVTPGTRVITGTERMRHRPIGVLVDALRRLGADIEYVGEDGFPPLRITGRTLTGGSLSIDGSISSQYISALLMIGPMLSDGLRLTLTGDIVSRPYIDLTLHVMHAYGATAEWVSDDTIHVHAGGYHPTPYYIENDWSAASYWYEIVALSHDAEITLPGLFRDSRQGDQAVKDMFLPLGVTTTFTDDGIIIKKDSTLPNNLNPLTNLNNLNPLNPNNNPHNPTRFLDLTRQPDLAQTLVVTHCLLDIPFRFTGLQSLRIKETDRITALERELRKWGYILHDEDDSVMWWDGERCAPVSAPIDTYEDHRMAMAFAPAALVRDDVAINNPQVVSKSYPTYWHTLQQAGFKIKEQSDTL